MERVGYVQSVRRYPVKSMAGEDLQEAFVSYAGLVGDRVYAFVDESNHSSFPWLTARQAHELLLLRPRFLQAPAPAPEADGTGFQLQVDTPSRSFEVTSPEFKHYLQERFGRPLRLRFSERGLHDARPLSLIGLATVEALGEEVGIRLDPRRFRANLYADWSDHRPFLEDELVGRQLQVGEKLVLMVAKKDQRCAIITLDPDTAAAAPQVLENVARRHGGCAGVYAVVVREGAVRPGDPIGLL